MKNICYVLAGSILVVCLCAGCATPPSPPASIGYLAVKKPSGVITTVAHNSVQKDFSRGGWYVGNYNFRPAPDVASYLEDISRMAGTGVVRNADVELGVPFAIDILFFGFASGTDTATAAGK